MNGVRDLQKVLEDQARDIGNPTEVIPEHLKAAMAGLESCVEGIIEASKKADDMKWHKRILHRRELKADAVKCSSDVDRALSLFQVRIMSSLDIFTSR